MASLAPMSGTLGNRLAGHLLRRCTYNTTKSKILTFASKTIDQAVDDLFVIPAPQLDEPIDPATGQPWINSGTNSGTSSNSNQRHYVKAWWIHEALHDTSIGSKLTFFLHSNFVVAFNIRDSEQVFDYLALLRHYSIGSFKTLANKITRDNVMLDYLDNENNQDNSPNENYAREFLELFTIGKGPQIGPGDYTNYTETDIGVAAKLLTGWKRGSRTDPANIDPDTGIARGYGNFSKHDETDKTFTAAFNNHTITGAVDAADMQRELDDFVNMVFDQDATALTICRKLYRYFVSDNITTEVENDIIAPLATTMRTNNYSLEITLKQLLKSQHFYDADDSESTDEIIGCLTKSPLENVLQVLSYFNVNIPDPNSDSYNHYHNWYKRSVIDCMTALGGMNVFVPASVAGYPAHYQEPGYHRNWFNSSSIVARYKMPQMLIEGKRLLLSGTMGGVQLDIVNFVQYSGVITAPANAISVVFDMINFLFPEIPPVNGERYNYFLNDVLMDGHPLFDWTEDWTDYINGAQDVSVVKTPLERLFKAIIYSQEFQMM